MVAGREFTEDDRTGKERVVIVSQSVAQRLFPNGDALNRNFRWTGALNRVGRHESEPSRIVGVVADVDDENDERAPAMAVYSPYGKGLPMPLFVRTSGDPLRLVPSVTRIIRDLSANQAVERPATLEDVRAEVLTPERLNAFVVSGFAGIALLIAVVGVSGVLAFSVSARTREFGVRLAIGSSPRRPAAARPVGGRVHCGGRHRRRRRGRLCVCRRGGELSRERALSRRAAGCRRGYRPRRRRRRRLADARGASVAGGCPAGAPVGVSLRRPDLQVRRTRRV